MCSIHTVFEIHYSFSIFKEMASAYHISDLRFIKTVSMGKSIFHLNLKNDVFGVFDVLTYDVKPFSDKY